MPPGMKFSGKSKEYYIVKYQGNASRKKSSLCIPLLYERRGKGKKRG